MPTTSQNAVVPVIAAASNNIVRLSDFAKCYEKVIKYLLDHEYTCYDDMPPLEGLHDYFPDIKKHRAEFKAYFAKLGMHYDVENTTIRIFVLQNYSHKFPSDKDDREKLLQGISDYMCDVYLNKAKVPKFFWYKRYQ